MLNGRYKNDLDLVSEPNTWGKAIILKCQLPKIISKLLHWVLSSRTHHKFVASLWESQEIPYFNTPNVCWFIASHRRVTLSGLNLFKEEKCMISVTQTSIVCHGLAYITQIWPALTYTVRLQRRCLLISEWTSAVLAEFAQTRSGLVPVVNVWLPCPCHVVAPAILKSLILPLCSPRGCCVVLAVS